MIKLENDLAVDASGNVSYVQVLDNGSALF
jgi:hypothetical protein